MVVLATKVYGDRDPALQSLDELVNNDIGQLEIDYQVGVRHDQFASVTIDGPDAVAARNRLAEQWGTITPDFEAGEIYRGTLEGWPSDGFVVDVGRELEVPAAELGLGEGTPEQVATRFGLVRHMPIQIRYGDPPTLAEATVDRLYEWRRGPGRLQANGVTRGQFRATINRAGHAHDIETIERLGLLEQSAICRPDTDPPGLLASIGPYLDGDLACVH